MFGIGTDATGNHYFKVATTEVGVDGEYEVYRSAFFDVDTDKPVLKFDLSLADVRVDETGTGLSLEGDAVMVSVLQGSLELTLLVINRFGLTLDPDGEITGSISAVPTDLPGFDFTVFANLSRFAGENVELRITAKNYDDGFYFADPNFDNFELIIPEPTTFVLVALGMLGARCLVRRRHGQPTATSSSLG